MDILDKAKEIQAKAAQNIAKRWEAQKASEIMRDFLSNEGRDGKSNLQNLLDEQQRIALESDDDKVRLLAIDKALTLAAGSDDKKETTVGSIAPMAIQINIAPIAAQSPEPTESKGGDLLEGI